VVLYKKYTGCSQNDFNVYAYLRAFRGKFDRRCRCVDAEDDANEEQADDDADEPFGCLMRTQA
jgi:hypothetical protein